MKYADPGFFPEAPVDFADDTLGVIDEGRQVVRASVSNRVPAMVADVVDENVEKAGKCDQNG